MPDKIITVDEASGIPLYGLDFLGILDRGTNVLEIKPITICNLKCDYCFVSAGDYSRNFIASEEYLLKWVKQAIDSKDCSDLEIHIAPYGEMVLYPEIDNLIRDLRQNEKVKVISAQTNGLLLTPERILHLQEVGLDRLNISLNSMDPELCAHLCGIPHYNLNHLLEMFDFVLQSSMELLIAPVWFMGVNDQGILDIIQYAKEKEILGFTWPKLRLGIQNYLTYKTGRKLGHVRSHEFKYFYQRLHQLENQFSIKLKLGPRDFNIHPTNAISPPVKIGDTASVEIIGAGRWEDEYIGKINDTWAVKILSKKALESGQTIEVEYIKGNLSGNLLTARY